MMYWIVSSAQKSMKRSGDESQSLFLFKCEQFDGLSFVKYPHHTDDLGKLQALIGKGMLATHTDEEWYTHRRSVARDFAKRAVIERYSPVVARHVEALVEIIARCNGAECNFSELSMQLSGVTPARILQLLGDALSVSSS